MGDAFVRACFDDRSLESSQSVVIERCLKSVGLCVAVVALVAEAVAVPIYCC